MYRTLEPKIKIKMFVSDLDGTLTDGKITVDDKGTIYKSFHAHDWMGFGLLRKCGIITVILTGSNDMVNRQRIQKFLDYSTINYFYDGLSGCDKADRIKTIAFQNNIAWSEIAYIGDDLNDIPAMKTAGYKACVKNSNYLLKKIHGIKKLKKNGGNGAVREYIDYLINKGLA